MSTKRFHALSRLSGFSLVELMISLVISLIVLAAVSSVMVRRKRANTAQTAQARMQDNARIAVQIMARDIRQAGYFGCSTGNGSNNFSNDLNGGNSGNPITNLTLGLSGANGSGPSWSADTSLFPLGNALPPGPGGSSPLSNSDIIVARYADGAGSLGVQTPYMNQNSSDLHVAAPNSIQPGDILMVTDCSGGDIFQVTNSNPYTSGSLVHNGGAIAGMTPGNATHNLSRTYSGDANIAEFLANTYYVANDTSGQPALFRMSVGSYEAYAAGKSECSASSGTPCWRADELVQGIEQIRVLYGVDAKGTKTANCYIKAGDSCNGVDLSTAAGWSKVYSVRIGVLARTLANNTIRGDKSSASGNSAELDSGSYDILGDGTYVVSAGSLTTAERRYQRHVFRTTVMVRNHPGT